MSDIKISILVPAFNVEEYIIVCLNSLVNQTLKEFEVIIVNDGSTDRTGQIAEEYAALDRRFHVIHQSHQGVSQARNTCLSLAKGKYVGFVDSDDSVSENAFEQLFLSAEAYSADIVLGSIMYCYENGTSCKVGDKTEVFQSQSTVLDGKRCFKSLLETQCYVPMVCGNLYRTAFMEQNNLHFEAAFHEDEYFTPYALFYADRVVSVEHNFYFYRQRLNSIMHTTDNLKERSESLYFSGITLKSFIEKLIGVNEPDEIEQSFLQQAHTLCERAQNLYESMLYSSPKKCLFIISETSTAAQYGIGTYIQQLSQTFDPLQWDVNVITLHALSKEIHWKIMNGTAYYEIPMPAGIPYFGASIEDKIYYKGVFYYLALRLNSLKKVYCHFNFVIHHDLAQLLKEKLHAKIVFTLHYTDWSFDLLGDREWLKHILKNPSGIKGKRVADKIEMEKRFMLEVCDYVIAIARHSYNMLKEVYGIPESKLVCIPNGLRDEYKKRNFEERQRLREKYGFKENEKLLIFAGRLDLVKGIIELIEAFKLIQIENSSVRLIIAGSGSLTRCFEAASPIWSHITFTGFIPKEQLDELYAISDIGIVPSIHEEFGYVATEMMLNELPVIVHNTTGLKEIVNDGKYGITFDFGKNRDVYMLKNIIVNALEQIEKGISLPNGRDKVLSTYSIQSFSERIVDVYLKCD